MTREEAQKRLDEWRIVEATGVWQDLMLGLGALERVHDMVLRESKDRDKIFKSQGAVKIISVIVKARENQIREAIEIMEGKHRTTERSARVQ